MKSALHISKLTVCGIVMLWAVGFASCSVDRTSDLPMPEFQSDYIRVAAEVKANVYTRANDGKREEKRYIPSGPVTNGDYILTYPFQAKINAGDTTYTYKLADVAFGSDGAESIGYATYWDEDKTTGQKKLVDLKWSDVTLRKATGTGANAVQKAVFYLDNVSPLLNNEARNKEVNSSTDNRDHLVYFYNDDEVTKPEQKNPFQAGVFDSDKGENDLLWGTTEEAKNTNKIDFLLHHNMSRVRVIINVKPRGDNGSMVDLSQVAKLELTNIHLRPEIFERNTGNLILPLVMPDDNTLTLVEFNETETVLGWESMDDDNSVTEEDTKSPYKAKIYTTQDFVLPPQDLANDSSRPTLRLTVPADLADVYDAGVDEVIFEASLPQNMYVKQSDEDGGSSSSRPMMPLSFMKEHVLTIKATVGPPDMNLEFAPVYVEDWVDMGVHDITGNQAGIYTNDDFFDFMKYYLAGNTALLEKYGYQDTTGKWNILFWSRNISLYREEGEGHIGVDEYLKKNFNAENSGYPSFEELLAAIPFSFVFNNYEIKVTGWEGYEMLSGGAGQTLLYNWLTGEHEKLPSISTKDDFMDLIAAYNANSTTNMARYGAYNNTDEQWVFEFMENEDEDDGTGTPDGEEPKVVVLNYSEIHDMMEYFGDNHKNGLNFAFKLHDFTVKITGLPNGEDIELTEENDGELILHAILSSPGIYSYEDVDLLIKAYNSPDKSEPEPSEPGTGDPGTTEPTEPKVDLSWLLCDFGEDNGSKWIFKFIRPIDMYGPDIYGSMIPDADHKDYDFKAVDSEGKDHNTMIIKVTDVGSSQYIYSYTNTGATIQTGGTKVGTRSFASSLKKLFAAGGEITSNADFKNMISYANDGNPVYRRYYGWYNDDVPELPIWEYPVTKSIKEDTTNPNNNLTYADLFGKLTSREPMELILVDETQVVVTGLPGNRPNIICRGKQGADILYRILCGTYTFDDLPEPGIETKGDFADMIDAYNYNKEEDMSLYGYHDEAAGKWIFQFTPTAADQIEIEYSTIHGKINKTSAAGEFGFSFTTEGKSRTVKVTGIKDKAGNDAGDIVLSGAAGEVLLHAIMTVPEKIMSKAELEWVMNAYNSTLTTFSLPMNSFSSVMSAVSPLAGDGSIDWILELFGSRSNNTWTFAFGSSMQLNGPDIYGKMIPDGSSRLDYTFRYDEGGVQVLDDGLTEGPERVMPGNLKKLFAASGAIASADDLYDMIEAAKANNRVTRRYYGAPNPADKWEYTIANSLTGIDFGTISASLKDIAEFNLKFASDVTVTLNVPRGYRPIVCTDREGAATLYSILRGSYPVPEPGIESTEDVEAMITAYAGGTDDRWIYGTQNETTGKWTFIFRQPMTLNIGDIFGRMPVKNGADYGFDLNGNDIKVTDGTDTETVDADQLKVLFTAGGSVTAANLQDAIEAANGNNSIKRRYYGKPSGTSKWEYQISESFTVTYGEISGELKATDATFSIANGVTVTITGLPGGRKVECTSTSNTQTLQDILRGAYTPEVGIMAGEITNLISAYSSNNENDLKAFGTKNGNTWTFTFGEPMTLNIDDIYGKMAPGADYEFDLKGNPISVSEDGSNTTTVDADQLKVLFTASGKIASAGDLYDMIIAAQNSNPVTRRFYGTLNAAGKWEHTIAKSLTGIDFNKINASLKNIAEFNLSFASDVTVTITGLPGGREVVCTSTSNTQTLQDILTGDYTPEVGIMEGEITNLIDAYSRNSEDDLNAFGKKNGNTWTFTFGASMTLDIDDIYGKMPVESGADYEFDLNGNPISVSEDGSNTTIVNADQLKILFTAGGSVTAANLQDAIDAANDSNKIVRRYYGKPSDTSWEYQITENITVKYNDISGELDAAADATFSIANGATVTIIEVPYKNPDIVCTSAESATLMDILLGRYEPEQPQQPDPGTGGDGDGDDGGDTGGGGDGGDTGGGGDTGSGGDGGDGGDTGGGTDGN